VNNILRDFLWVCRKDANGGHCHVKWDKVARPFWYDRLGIPHLARMAIILRVRWLWRMLTDPSQPWGGLDMQFSRNESRVCLHYDNAWGWGLRPVLGRHVDWREIGEGLALDLYALVRSRPQKHCAVHQTLASRSWIIDFSGALGPHVLWQYDQLWVHLYRVQLTEVPDALDAGWPIHCRILLHIPLFRGHCSQLVEDMGTT
jgi:hypothetical protein